MAAEADFSRVVPQWAAEEAAQWPAVEVVQEAPWVAAVLEALVDQAVVLEDAGAAAVVVAAAEGIQKPETPTDPGPRIRPTTCFQE